MRRSGPKTTLRVGDGPAVDAGPMLEVGKLAERVEYLIGKHQEVAALKADIKAGMDAAERAGWSKKALAEHIRRCLETDEQRDAREGAERALADIQRKLGAWNDTPLGRFSPGDNAVQ